MLSPLPRRANDIRHDREVVRGLWQALETQRRTGDGRADHGRHDHAGAGEPRHRDGKRGDPARSTSSSPLAHGLCLARPGKQERGSTGVTGPLSDIRVVEVSAFIAAPLGGMTLAQLGADVIRLDRIACISRVGRRARADRSGGCVSMSAGRVVLMLKQAAHRGSRGIRAGGGAVNPGKHAHPRWLFTQGARTGRAYGKCLLRTPYAGWLFIWKCQLDLTPRSWAPQVWREPRITMRGAPRA